MELFMESFMESLTETIWVKLRSTGHFFFILPPGEMEGDNLMANNIHSRLNIARNSYCSTIVIFDELIGAPNMCFWVITVLINLEEFYVLYLDVVIGH
jgi:hypothetical protein